MARNTDAPNIERKTEINESFNGMGEEKNNKSNVKVNGSMGRLSEMN